MTAASMLASTDRLLVFAPHPDDETLATGELIQTALAAGASVRVIFATDVFSVPNVSMCTLTGSGWPIA